MSSDSPFWLHSVSVVVTAEFHNPSILSHSFLVSEGIVPKEWEVKEPIVTPPLSVLRYNNGIQWIVEQTKLVLSENLESSFQEKYQIHRIASRYLEKLPHVPYRSLGLNCEISLSREDPQQWLIDQFLKSDILLKHDLNILGMVPKFTLAMDDALLHVTLSGGNAQRGVDKSESAVIIDCNLHFEGPLNSVELREEIQQWPSSQDSIVSVLKRLLENP